MAIKLLIALASLLLLSPSLASASEQAFVRNGLKAVIRLSPDALVAGGKANMALRLEQEGAPLTDRKVELEVYEKEAAQPILKREVDPLDGEYVDSWEFAKPGDYRVVVSISDPGKSAEALRYEVAASVGEAATGEHAGHEDHGFFSHHFGGGKWKWWGAGLMVLMMVPMVALGL